MTPLPTAGDPASRLTPAPVPASQPKAVAPALPDGLATPPPLPPFSPKEAALPSSPAPSRGSSSR